MNQDIVKDFRDLLAVETAKLNASIKQDIGKSVAEANARGMLNSSASMQAVTRCAAAALPTFTNAAFNIFLRTATAHGMKIGSDNRNEAHALLAEVAGIEVEEMRDAVRRSPPFQGKLADKFADRLLEQLNYAAKLELDRLDGELRLIAAQNQRPTSEGGATIIVNAPVGVLQTGPVSFGIASQQIDSGTAEALQKALVTLLADLATVDGDGRVDIAEIREMTEEAKVELEKPKPNATKLKTLVQGIGSTISFLPKLKAAYDTLKWAALGIGVTLP